MLIESISAHTMKILVTKGHPAYTAAFNGERFWKETIQLDICISSMVKNVYPFFENRAKIVKL